MTTKGTKKSALSKVGATSKTAAKSVKPKHRLPSPEMLADLTDVFKKHGWAGLPQHLAFASTSGDGTCPDGSSPRPVTIRCPGGIVKVVLVCPGDDPGC